MKVLYGKKKIDKSDHPEYDHAMDDDEDVEEDDDDADDDVRMSR